MIGITHDESGIPHLKRMVGELEQAVMSVSSLARELETAAAAELQRYDPSTADYYRLKLITRSIETIKEKAAKLHSKNIFEGIVENLNALKCSIVT